MGNALKRLLRLRRFRYAAMSFRVTPLIIYHAPFPMSIFFFRKCFPSPAQILRSPNICERNILRSSHKNFALQKERFSHLNRFPGQLNSAYFAAECVQYRLKGQAGSSAVFTRSASGFSGDNDKHFQKEFPLTEPAPH